MKTPSKRLWIALGALALSVWFVWVERRAGDLDAAPVSQIEQLHQERRSGVMVEAVGNVAKLLPDDVEGARHQRFIVRLASGHTLLISHNIDLAPRLDSLKLGDEVRFRGQYEWNARGGVVHWTHRDPRGETAGGWLQYAGRTYH